MIQEAYISFETAKLLKEKGFDGACTKTYIQGSGAPIILSVDVGTVLCDNEVYAPTQQMAMRWLREVHNLFVLINTQHHYVAGNKDKTFFDWYYLVEFVTDEHKILKESGFFNFKSYEEAVEAGIK